MELDKAWIAARRAEWNSERDNHLALANMAVGALRALDLVEAEAKRLAAATDAAAKVAEARALLETAQLDSDFPDTD